MSKNIQLVMSWNMDTGSWPSRLMASGPGCRYVVRYSKYSLMRVCVSLGMSRYLCVRACVSVCVRVFVVRHFKTC